MFAFCNDSVAITGTRRGFKEFVSILVIPNAKFNIRNAKLLFNMNLFVVFGVCLHLHNFYAISWTFLPRVLKSRSIYFKGGLKMTETSAQNGYSIISWNYKKKTSVIKSAHFICLFKYLFWRSRLFPISFKV